MGSGESDARLIDKVHTVEVTSLNQTNALTGTTSSWGTFTYPYTSTWYSSYPIYYYQIKCPAPRCKTMNWLELDKIKGCTKCGSLLKAVSKVADYEVAIE